MTKLFSVLTFASLSLVVSAAHAGFPPPDEMLCYENCEQTHSRQYCLAHCYGSTEGLFADDTRTMKIGLQRTECQTQPTDQAAQSEF